ncbi:S-adenosyl-L-methionine-dependent methyltransferase [Triangularia setosa]|uniref:S-adenosyl-L-methionine-dependent methyltransferase n=1 Tax=Triangularia setosa TaxID=2587417 RepID=A0AAN7ADJ1_9PEZI|nr:S-adenosyl-L-methionine-dependent methyltransferase [Podospora setosa]
MDESDLQTVPVDNTYREVITLNGRDFQRYAVENSIYFAPVDDDEIDRLHYQHELFNLVFENRLIFPPVPRPQRILDCGSGSGAWAIEVAEQYPECEVIGLDIYPYPVPEDIPENVVFQVDDLNSPSTFPSNYFDLVNSRLMSGGIHVNRWTNYLSDIFRVLRPGGWCQMVEIYYNAQSDNGTLTANHALQVWSQSYLQSIQHYKDPRVALRLQALMTQAGFVEVESRLLTLPLSGWSNDPRDREVGAANRANVHRLLSSLAMYPFSQGLGMSNTDIQLLVAQARNEADNPAYVCIGRKPGSSRSHRHSEIPRSHTPSSSKGGRQSDSRKRARH